MKNFLYERNFYLDKIESYFDKPVIKVITGLRRVGKSVILRQLVERLKKKGVPEKSIVYIDKESLDFEAIATYKDLNKFALQYPLKQNSRRYLIVDEIQDILEWEKAIASLFGKGDTEILITGSNAGLFSSELATKLSGRYIEISVHSLNFSEFLLFRGHDRLSDEKEFYNYIQFGGLPGIHAFDLNDNQVFQYIHAIYNTVLLKDIIIRNSVRNISLLENMGKYVFEGVGSTFSAKSIADYLKSQKLKIGVETVQNYLEYFKNALILKQCSRYDIKGKRTLEISEKYYVSDLGLRSAIIGWREGDINAVLENIVYNELLRRGYEIFVGKINGFEIDFIATRVREKCYIQVAYLLESKKTIDRELRPLKLVNDNYTKVIISMDKFIGKDFEGIRRINMIDFCMGESI